MALYSRRKYAQSAVVPFVLKNGAVELLLITNRSGNRWVIPKGNVEGSLTALESAVREAYEEGGIKARPTNRQSVSIDIGNGAEPAM